LTSRQSLTWPRNHLSFMEPEDSLTCSQVPATGPYSETDESKPYHHTLF
jgi:hypothetical protein